VRKGSSVAFSKPGPSSEELIVVLEARTASDTEREALKESVKQRIVEQMQLTPTDVVVCPMGSLPKTSSGKLQRSKTRQQYLDGTVGQEGNRSLGSNAEKVVLARHVALSLLGRSRHRARRIAEHALEVRSVTDALGKLRLAGDYVSTRLTRLF
jgi:fatty-acyl-CoA synthase